MYQLHVLHNIDFKFITFVYFIIKKKEYSFFMYNITKNISSIGFRTVTKYSIYFFKLNNKHRIS